MTESYILTSPITGPRAEPTPDAPAPAAEATAPEATAAPAVPAAPPASLELGAAARPAWLPAQYKTPEDMARALEAAQAKLSGKPDTNLVSETDLNGYMQEVVGSGALSDTSRRALRAKGFTDALIDQHVMGLQAIRENQMSKTFQIAGGQDRYAKIAAWAAANLPTGEQANYNAAVNSGNPAIIEIAVQGLKARYELAGGEAAGAPKPAPVRLTGGAPGASPGAMFNTMADQVKAMKDPRYQVDPGYRAKVESMIDAAIKAKRY